MQTRFSWYPLSEEPPLRSPGLMGQVSPKSASIPSKQLETCLAGGLHTAGRAETGDAGAHIHGYLINSYLNRGLDAMGFKCVTYDVFSLEER